MFRPEPTIPGIQIPSVAGAGGGHAHLCVQTDHSSLMISVAIEEELNTC